MPGGFIQFKARVKATIPQGSYEHVWGDTGSIAKRLLQQGNTVLVTKFDGPDGQTLYRLTGQRIAVLLSEDRAQQHLTAWRGPGGERVPLTEAEREVIEDAMSHIEWQWSR